MSIFKRNQVPQYNAQEWSEYQDGFATGYPLRGQPNYPKHNSAAYRRGVKLGKKAFKAGGSQMVDYEPAGSEE